MDETLQIIEHFPCRISPINRMTVALIPRASESMLSLFYQRLPTNSSTHLLVEDSCFFLSNFTGQICVFFGGFFARKPVVGWNTAHFSFSRWVQEDSSLGNEHGFQNLDGDAFRLRDSYSPVSESLYAQLVQWDIFIFTLGNDLIWPLICFSWVVQPPTWMFLSFHSGWNANCVEYLVPHHFWAALFGVEVTQHQKNTIEKNN